MNLKKPASIIKPKPEVSVSEAVSTHDVTQMVKISHTQGVKQSRQYQTGDVSFSIELYVQDSPKTIEAGLKRAANIVENALAPKLEQMGELVDALGKGK